MAYRKPAAIGKRWAGLQFENGAQLGVLDLPMLLDAQDDGRLRGVVLFDSPANHTCPASLLRSRQEPPHQTRAAAPTGDSASLDKSAAPDEPRSEGATLRDALPAPRFFPRDYEVALGGPDGQGLWRKGGKPWDDPDIFVSKAGTRTHVHIDSHCTRFWMVGLSGRKLWRVMPPEEGVNLAPTPKGERLASSNATRHTLHSTGITSLSAGAAPHHAHSSRIDSLAHAQKAEGATISLPMSSRQRPSSIAMSARGSARCAASMSSSCTRESSC